MPNEQSVQESIESTGGIPVISVSLEVSGMTAYPTDKTLNIADMAADAKEVGDRLDVIEAAISGIVGESYPVGSIYMTTSNSAPEFTGTWVEVGITATWTQLRTGKRDYETLDSEDTGGSVHFWLRTA